MNFQIISHQSHVLSIFLFPSPCYWGAPGIKARSSLLKSSSAPTTHCSLILSSHNFDKALSVTRYGGISYKVSYLLWCTLLSPWVSSTWPHRRGSCQLPWMLCRHNHMCEVLKRCREEMALGRKSSASQLGYHPYPNGQCLGSQGCDSWLVLPKSCMFAAGFQLGAARAHKGQSGMAWCWQVLLVAHAPWALRRCEIAATPHEPPPATQGAERRWEHITVRFPAKTRTKVILF